MRNTTRQPPPVAAAKAAARFFVVVARVFVVVATSVFFVRPVSGAPAVFFTSFRPNEGDRIRFDDGAALENTGHYFGRLSEENVLEKLRLFNNDAEKEAGEVDATILLDQPRWTLADERLMAKLLFSSRENVEEETKKKTMLFAPRFSRSHERREEEKTKHTVKEKIEKRASEDSSLRSRVRYWNCDTSDNGDKNVDQQVKAILGVLTGSSKEDKEPTERVGIVICGGEKKEEDFSLFQALMKALMKAERSFVSGVVGGETAGRVEGSVNSSGDAEGTKGAEEREKRRDLLYSKGPGSKMNECDDLCQLHVTILSCLIIFWIFAGTFTFGIGMMSNLDTPKIYEKSDE